MQARRLRFVVINFLLAVIAISLVGCSGERAPGPGKIPVTTSSSAALQSYLKGRSYRERMRFAEAREHFLRAIAEDSQLALAHLGLANTAANVDEIFERMGRAVELVDLVSEGERHQILAFEAGINGEPDVQLNHLQELVGSYPEDERAWTLIAVFYANRQEYSEAIECLERAIGINPEYPPPYNWLGYARRYVGDYSGSEVAFKRYIELIPDEPNPYDSYAELLMQLGRFEESIIMYERALEHDLNFIPSYVGIGLNHVFLGQPQQARNAFTTLSFIARNDAEKRQAYTWSAMSYIHDRDHERALGEIRKRLAIAEAGDDWGAMVTDFNFMGNILLDGNRIEDAEVHYLMALEISETSALTTEVKETLRRNHIFNASRIALARGDLEEAQAQAEDYLHQVSVNEIPGEVWQAHQLLGLIALEADNHATALSQLEQANQLSPTALFAKAQALEGLGELEAARQTCESAANLNSRVVEYAYVRLAAREMLSRLDQALARPKGLAQK
jgi:tetratricopeptide (TPR) repeat protein